jgi:hypothetical protein
MREPSRLIVAIPTYNSTRVLLDSIASMLRQSLSNLEIVVIDDAYLGDRIPSDRYIFPACQPPQLIASETRANRKLPGLRARSRTTANLFIEDRISPVASACRNRPSH